MSHYTYLATRSGHEAYHTLYTHIKKVSGQPWTGFFIVFLTHTIAHTPQRELEPHIYDTPIHHSHTHFVYEYNTYYCTDVTYIGYTGQWTYLNTIIAYLYVSLLV
jgi:hypothetical protein